MQKEKIVTSAEHDADTDEELVDILIAISVVAKRLAKTLSNESQASRSKQEDTVCTRTTD